MNRLTHLHSLPENACYAEMDSPVGKLTLITSFQGLHAILWDTDRTNAAYEKVMATLIPSDNETTIQKTKKQLNEYFHGQRKRFDLPLVLHGTHFQTQVWEQLLKIPYATTISYAQQAERIRDKNSARAVGTANGLNPISIIIPCHRVIGKNGHLSGFSGGTDKKASLLKLE